MRLLTSALLGSLTLVSVGNVASASDARALSDGLHTALARPLALVIYLAGADPYAGDRIGRLALSKEGLARRDHLVLATCRDAGLPVAVSMAGGYAHDIDDIVDIHLRTVEIASMAAAGVVQASTSRP